MKKSIDFSRLFFTTLSLFIVTTSKAQDTVLYARDSVIELNEDCNAHLFIEQQQISVNKTILITKQKKTVSLAGFIKPLMQDAVQWGWSDLDNNGKKELIIYNYTGGDHCCDELYFFKVIAPDKYLYAGKTVAGQVCITETSKEMFYNFGEVFGDFFTSYASIYEDSSVSAPEPVHGVWLKYSQGRINIIPGDKELLAVINDNLGKLSELPYQKLETGIDQDNGLRKEFAMNLAAYYYSFGRSKLKTKILFDKNYKFPDAQKVWARFLTILYRVEKQNDF